MSTSVFVLDKKHRPLMPCRPARARRLLRAGRARVVKRFPFVIRLVDRTVEQSEVQPVLIKLDPGSRETGAAVVRDDEKKRHHALAFFVIEHRGGAIRDALKARSAFRRRRRSQNLRCRSPRFLNRVKPKGWLPPSLRHRVETTLSFVRRMCRYLPVSGIATELVKFDSQKLQTPEVSGIEYQQGTLFEYEVREYLLEKFGRKCVYCGAEGVPLNIDHVVPRAKGGSNRVSNLVLACVSCNQKKGARSLEDFLKGKPEVLARVRRELKTPLRDAAAVNATRWVLFNELKATGLPVETGSGALTKFNRHAFGVEKEHWLDALAQRRSDAEGTQRPGDQMHGAGEPSTHAPHEVRLPARVPDAAEVRPRLRDRGHGGGERPQGKEGRTVARTRCGPRLGLIQHSDAEGRHSRRRLEALPTDFTQRRIWVRVARPRTSFLPCLKAGVS